MENFYENGLARMYGPHFLLLFIVLSLLTALFLWKIAPKIAGRTNGDPATIPLQPDPYELAWMRGKEREVITLVIYNLVKRGYLAWLSNGSRTKIEVKQKIENLRPEAMSPLEFSVYDSLAGTWELKNFLQYVSRNVKFTAKCEQMKEELQNQQLIWSTREARRYLVIKAIAIALLVLLGIYKLFAATAHGHHNIWLLVILIPLSMFSLSKITMEEGITGKGEHYLEQMKNAFRQIRGNTLLEQPPYLQELLIGIYGFALLESSSLGFLNTYLVHAWNEERSLMRSDLTSSSGGCSSGGCGGCGGGCGGCS